MGRKFKNDRRFYTSSKERIPGLFSPKTNNPEKEDPAEKDRNNRFQIIEKIRIGLEAGKNIEEVCKNLSEDENIRKQFEYLTRAGLKLDDIFKNWYTSKVNTDKKIHERNSSHDENNREY